MLKKFIKKIRARPEHVRTTYALIMSLSVTAVIASFWIVSYIDKSNEILSKKTPNDPADFLNKVSDEVGGSYSDMKDRFNFSKIFENPNGASSSMSSDDTMVGLGDISSSSSDVPDDGTTKAANDNVDSSQPTYIQPAPAQPASVSNNSQVNTQNNTKSTSLDDILNTKKQDNQGNNATTSN